MLKAHSIIIAEMLTAANATPEVNGFFKGFYPLVGNVEAQKPFITYRLSELPKPTKNDLREYDLQLTVVAETYNTSALGYDHIRKYMIANVNGAKFTGGDTSYINEMDACIADLNYNLKIQ
jgi:hypothetical protein